MKRIGDRSLPALAMLFFISGAAGLGYQVLWAKALGAGIGHEYPATLAVVTAFLSGMALGALAYDFFRWSYPVLELGIGLWGAHTVLLIPSSNRLVSHLLGLSPPFAWHWAVVFAVVFLLLLPATAAMGATLPAIQQVIAATGSRTITALLYSVNTAGAMLGALFAAFCLMPLLGIRNSILFFAALNIACAILAFQLGASEAIPSKEAPRPRRWPARLFFAGVLGIGFEIVVIRALSHVLENTVYTFAVVLAVYLLGMTLGAAIYHRSGPVKKQTLFAGLAVTCVISAISLRWVPGAYFALRSTFGDSVVAVALAESTVALIAFLLPAIFMGATFSALAAESLETEPSLAWSVFANSLGAAIAPLIFGLLIIPKFGLQVALGAIVFGYAALAGRLALPLAVVCAVATPFLTASRDLVAHPQQNIVFHREGLMASVSVLESTNGARVLKVNNRFQMGGTAARNAEARHADIPLLLHPNPKRALFIGLGTGITFATAAHYTDVRADGVELLSEVAQAMPYFQQSPRDLENPNLRVYIADGRRFVLASTNLYDVVVGDLFHPAQDGAAFLYTREHFVAVRTRLAEGGLFCQWLPLFQMDLDTFDIIARTFATVFPSAEVWLLRLNVDTPVVGLIGWIGPSHQPPDLVERKVATSETLREHLRTIAMGDTLRLMGSRLGFVRAPAVREINTDNNPIVLFKAPGLTFHRNDEPGARLLELVERYPPVAEGPLGDFVKARNAYLRGLLKQGRRDRTGAVQLFIESARLSSEFTSGYAEALGIATSLARSNPTEAEQILRALVEAQPERPVARQLLERLK